MALYTTSSPSVNNTSTLNDSLTANHHIQPEKRPPLMENDNSLPAKRKRISMTIAEPNIAMNTLLPSCFPLVTSANESTTMSITDQTSTKFHSPTTTTATLPLQTKDTSLLTKLHDASVHQDTLVKIETAETSQQNPRQQYQRTSVQQHQQASTRLLQQKTMVSSPPLSSSFLNQPSPTSQRQDTSETVKATETSQQPSTQQQEMAVALSPSSSFLSSQPPPTSQRQGTLETVEATETSQQISTQQQEIAVSLSPSSSSISSQPPLTSWQHDTSEAAEIIETSQQPSTQQQEIAVSLSSSSLSITNQPLPTLEETVPPTKPTTSATVDIVPIHDALPLATPVQETAVSEGRSKRKRKPVEYNVKLWETFKQITPRKRQSRETPRWYTQSYMVFLALREHPSHCLSRPALINAALAMDEKISKERNLPKVFRSKTPTNSASAILTNNLDRYYIPYKPEGSRSLWFRLAYTPGNFDHAYGEYRKWMDKLINHDWLHCFGVPLENSTPMTMVDAAASSTSLPTIDFHHPTTDSNNKENSNTIMTDADTSSNAPPPLNDSNSINSGSTKESDNGITGTKDNAIPGTSPSTATKLDQVHHHQPMYQLDQLDLSNVPTKWQDIVRVDASTIPNSGQGLFAVRELPYNTPLGFYFGVPMTEYEFDSIKENVGRASEYSIKYRKTILDATDEQGEPYTLGNNNDDGEEPQRLCPFHYMNEAKDVDMANILFVEGVVVNQVICWSKRPILPGEELLVWYGTDVNRYWKDDTDQQQTSS